MFDIILKVQVKLIEMVELKEEFIYLSRMRWFGIIKRNLARFFSSTFLVLVYNFVKTYILLRKWEGNALFWRKTGVLEKLQPIFLLKPSQEAPLPLPWVLPALCYSWCFHHIISPVSDWGWFCRIRNVASAQVRFHPSYPQGGWWVPDTRHPHLGLERSHEEGRSHGGMDDGFHHRQPFAQLPDTWC